MRNSYKTFGVILLILFFLVGGYYFSKKPEGESKNENISTTAPEKTETEVSYKNTKYGFSVTLPQSWKGFEVINDEWEGYSLTNGGTMQEVTETGPLIFLRHPKWREEEPRQDIPVMIFTLKQWADLDKDVFHIGASPVNPREITQNKIYVFALPARYNYSFYTGFEEVEELIVSGAIKSL